MEPLQQFVADHPLLTALQIALTVWMLVDARRRADVEPYWFWVVLLVPVVGAWAYFFIIVVPSMPTLRLPDWLRGRPSLEELRYRAESQPTLVNHLVLGQRLMERDEHEEALPHLLTAQKMEPEHGLVLYTLARCHAEQGRPQEAVPVLEGLVARDPRWANYSAWRLLAKVRAEAGDAAGAAQACRDLARLTGTLECTCMLGEYLLAAGEATEARAVLDRALRDHDFAPAPSRRRNARWARQARRLLKQAEKNGRPNP